MVRPSESYDCPKEEKQVNIRHQKTSEISIFVKDFLLICIFMVALMLFISISNYYTAKKVLKEEVYKSNNDLVTYFTDDIDSMLATIDNTMQQMLSNPSVDTYISQQLSLDKYSNIVSLNNLSNILKSILETNPYIEGFRIYSVENRMCVTDAKVNFIGDKDVAALQKYMEGVPGQAWIEAGKELPVEGKSPNIRFVCRLNSSYSVPAGLMVIELKGDVFFKVISQMVIRNTGYIAVLNEQNVAIVNNNHLEGSSLFQQILKQTEENPQRDFIVKDDSERYLITYNVSKYNDWKYIAIVNEREILSKLSIIGNNLLILAVILLILILIGSYCLARGIYNPIKRLYEFISEVDMPSDCDRIQEEGNEFSQISSRLSSIVTQLQSVRSQKELIEKQNIALQQDLDKNGPMLKQYFIYRLILGDIGDKSEIRENAIKFGIDCDNKFVVAVVQFNPAEGSEITEDVLYEQQSGLIDVFEGLLLKDFNPVKIFFEEGKESNKMFVLVSFPSDELEEELIRKFKVQCEFFQNILHSEFSLECTIGIGGAADKLSKIRQSALDAENMLKYNFMFGQSVICKNEVITKAENSLSYFYLKKDFKNKLLNCKYEDIDRILRENFALIRDNEEFFTDYIYFCKDFINTLYDFLIEKGIRDSDFIQELTDCFINFELRFKNFESVMEWAIDYVSRALKRFEHREEGIGELVAKVVELIHKLYNTDLSLAEVSDKLGVSTPYLSRLFKEQMGQTFKDYLTMVKMEKAKELLEKNDMTVTEVAQKVGYNNYKQFSAMFKKYTYMTPNQYYRNSRMKT